MDLSESGGAALARAIEELPDRDLTGTRVGRYTIQGLIGKGGMGAVYRAVREDDFRMQVAIKLLNRGTDTEGALGRFRAERQILAGLQHPNIARLLDGGATGGGPALLRDGVRGRHAALGIRRAASGAPAPGVVPPGVRGGAARAPESDCAPGHQAGEPAGDPGRNSEAAGFRDCEAAGPGGGRIYDGTYGRGRAPDDAGIRESGAGARRAGDDGNGYLFAGGGALRTADGPAGAHAGKILGGRDREGDLYAGAAKAERGGEGVGPGPGQHRDDGAA